MNKMKLLSIFTACPLEKWDIKALVRLTNLSESEIEKQLVILRKENKVKGVRKIQLAGELLKKAKSRLP